MKDPAQDNTTLVERKAALEDVALRYVTAGTGPPVVLVHGLGNSVVSWRSNIRPLSQHFRVFALDLPGHGLSTHYDGRYNLSFIGRFMGQFLDLLELSEVSLVGSSLGGLISMKTALELPDRVRSLVLVGSAGLGRELALFLRILSLPWIGAVITKPTRENTAWSLRRLMQDHSLITNELIDEVHRYRAVPGGTKTMLSILRYGVDIRGQKDKVIMHDRLAELGKPTLIVWGVQDRIIPVSHAYNALRRIKGSRLHIFEECGHWPQMEKSEDFNTLVTRFLQEVYSGGSREEATATNVP
ncbi:MAG: alpha/beta fold hydrolase [Dehalococcoidia bacterium]